MVHYILELLLIDADAKAEADAKRINVLTDVLGNFK